MKRQEFSAIMALSAALCGCGSDTTTGPGASGATSSSGGSSGAASGSSSGATTGTAAGSGSTSGGGSGAGSGGASGSASGTSSGATSGSAPSSGGASGSGSGSSTGAAEGGAPDAALGQEAGPSPDGGTGTVCGTTPAALDVTKIGKMEQMSVAPDGTIYFSNQGPSIGRYAPPYITIDKTWKTIPGSRIQGIALDPKRGVLYAGSREAPDKLYAIQVATPAMMTTVTLPSSMSVNGVTISNDATVYYTDQTMGNVYRIGPTETAPTKVNTMPVAQANDLAFGPDGLLYVNIWSPTPATIIRLNVQNGLAVSQELFVTLTGSGNGDGIAFDSAGNLYAAAGQLYKVTPARVVTSLGVPAAAGMEFGCGAISCNDLFYSAPAGVLKMTVTTPGLDVFWHRP